MGSSPSKEVPKLKAVEIQEFSKQTLISSERIENLYTHYYNISTLLTDDGVIDYAEFCNTLRLPSESFISERMFALFDTNSDGVINFREFLLGISTFLISFDDSSTRNFVPVNKVNEQVDLAFRLFDTKRNGRVYYPDFVKLLKSAIKEHTALSISDDQLEQISDLTFRSVAFKEDEHGKYVSKEEYRKLLMKKHSSLVWLSVDLERAAEGARRLLKRRKTRGCI
mmetsp:Transcript_1676/g.3590  ORF Transcript_1676/g.3590 Transcript_1676/m.3590 type:complete len:225 (-) Transcript_1676:494-1168(-)